MNRFLLDKYKALISTSFEASFMGKANLEMSGIQLLSDLDVFPTTSLGRSEFELGEVQFSTGIENIDVLRMNSQIPSTFEFISEAELIYVSIFEGNLEDIEFELTSPTLRDPVAIRSAANIVEEFIFNAQLNSPSGIPIEFSVDFGDVELAADLYPASAVSAESEIPISLMQLSGALEEISAPQFETSINSTVELITELEQSDTFRMRGEFEQTFNLIINSQLARAAEVDDLYSGTVDSQFYGKTMSDDIYLVIL